MELEHSSESTAQKKAQQLNQLAGYSRFSVVATPLPGKTSTLRNSWSIKDSKTGRTYAVGSIAGDIGLTQLTNELKKQSVDAVSQSSPKARRLRHDDFNDGNDKESLNHYGVLGMKWGVRKDKKGLERKGKYTKEENKRRKDLTRAVTAAQRNLVDKQKISADAENILTRAKKENQAARQMTVLPWNRSKKRELVAETEKFVREAMKDVEIPRADVERASKYVKKQISALKEFSKEMNEKYGSENINQLQSKKKEVYIGEGMGYVNDFLKVGVNMANFPVVGNFVAAEYVTAWEDADREEISKRRSGAIESNRY